MLASWLVGGVLAFFAAYLGGREAIAQVPPGVVGPQYFIDLTAVDPNTDMTLGMAKMLFDTGANTTYLSRANAQSLGLLNAAGNPVASLDSGVRGNVTNANGMVFAGSAVSIGLRLSIIGKNAGGTDIGNRVFPSDEKNVVFRSPELPTSKLHLERMSSRSYRLKCARLVATCVTLSPCRPTRTEL